MSELVFSSSPSAWETAERDERQPSLSSQTPKANVTHLYIAQIVLIYYYVILHAISESSPKIGQAGNQRKTDVPEEVKDKSIKCYYRHKKPNGEN